MPGTLFSIKQTMALLYAQCHGSSTRP
ncbi:MAG: hypothetical protein JWP81_434, partial [Ferruginibacter sp.]|nr:hypothetical protein [Ferruginibacter sp.]